MPIRFIPMQTPKNDADKYDARYIWCQIDMMPDIYDPRYMMPDKYDASSGDKCCTCKVG